MTTTKSPTRLTTVLAIAGHEYRAALRGRMVPAFGALFACLSIGIAIAGLGASGQLLVQGFTRTAVSLLTLALYLLPLLGVVLGASAFGGEDGSTELLLAQPVSRAEALGGRVLGLVGALATIALAGFGIAGVLVGISAGADGVGGFVVVAAGATIVGLVGLGVGTLIGILVRRKATAVGWALAAWFLGAVLYDLACIGILQVFGDGQPAPWLAGVLALNPVDGVRSVTLIALGADVLLGPAGAALARLMGGVVGTACVAASVVAWLTLPLASAAMVYRRRDF